MRRMVLVGIALMAIALAGTASSAQTPPNVVVRTVISGQVLSLQLAALGQTVKLGDTLVFVRVPTGSAIPAAHATAAGKIVQMLVRSGDFVNIGDPVAVIEVQ